MRGNEELMKKWGHPFSREKKTWSISHRLPGQVMQLRIVTIRPVSEILQIQSASTLWWYWGDGAPPFQSQEDSAMLPALRIPLSLGAFALVRSCINGLHCKT
jgi:hypothetical protein